MSGPTWTCNRCAFAGNVDADVACFVCSAPREEPALVVPEGRVRLREVVVLLSLGTVVALLAFVLFAPPTSEPAGAVPNPAGSRPAASEPASGTPAPSDAPGTYTVRTGDTLYSIAVGLGVSEDQLRWWNLTEHPSLRTNPQDIVVGWVLITAGEPMPTPTPRPTPRPSVAPAVPTFFDLFPAEVRIVYYEVSGADPSELLSSMYAGGPWSDWLNQRAIGQTRAEVVDAVGFRMTSDGSCQVVPTDNPAITYRFTVTLPHWTPPAGANPSTVSWWTSELEDIATHEAHHVLLYRNSEPALNAAVASSTCSTLSGALTAIVDEADRNNCLFDLAEYGFALGLTEANCY